MLLLAATVDFATDDLDRRVGEYLESGRYRLPVFPRVAQAVLEAAQDERRGAADVARMVEKDPAICGKVLAAASSSLYGGARVVSIKQAVARIGTAEVALLATAIALEGAVFKPGPFDELLAECWRSCVTTGMFAKEIARVRRRGLDTAFLCGLFHLVGQPIALDVLVRIGVQCRSDTARAVAERHQAKLGVAAVQEWGMSASVSAAVAFARGGDPPPDTAEDVHTVRLAAALGRWAIAENGDPERARETIDTLPALVELNLYPDDLLAIRNRGAAIAASLEALR
jgi:HD-like signal output (HDOD) protein